MFVCTCVCEIKYLSVGVGRVSKEGLFTYVYILHVYMTVIAPIVIVNGSLYTTQFPESPGISGRGCVRCLFIVCEIRE